MNQRPDYKGFCLFNDIEDQALRNRNRAVVLTNLAADHTKDRKINGKGASLILGYFNVIPDAEKRDVQALFTKNMQERGYVIATS